MNRNALLVAVAILLSDVMPNTGRLHASSDSVLRCPAGFKSECVPHLAGKSVLCEQGSNYKIYESISHYCLSCHATSRPMLFKHPLLTKYPVARREFRKQGAMHKSIKLYKGFLTCITCHAGTEAESHFLAEYSGLANFCGRCHISGIMCSGKPEDRKSICYPGRINSKVECVWDKKVSFYESTTEFCVGCHEGAQAMASFHAVEIEYPHNRQGLTPLADLDPAIKLDEGRVTCESCHAKKDEGFGLCKYCHPMRY